MTGCLGVLASLLSLAVVGLTNPVNYWITMCCYGFFSGPVFVSGMTWCDRYVQMTATAFAVMDIAIGVGVFTFNWLYGYLLNRYPDNVVVVYYIGLGCAVIGFVLFTLMQVRGHLHGDRYAEVIVCERNDNMIDNNKHTDNMIDNKKPISTQMS